MTSPFGRNDGHVLAGLVDIQVNGAYGFDFTTDPTSIWDVARLLPRHGVTAFLPTVISSPVELAIEAMSVGAAGLADGEYRIGTVDVTVTDGVVRNRDGALAGSAATLDRVVAVMRRATGWSLDDLAAMASATPSAIVGHRPGPGDAVLVDDDLAVVATASGGEVVWERQA